MNNHCLDLTQHTALQYDQALCGFLCRLFLEGLFNSHITIMCIFFLLNCLSPFHSSKAIFEFFGKFMCNLRKSTTLMEEVQSYGS